MTEDDSAEVEYLDESPVGDLATMHDVDIKVDTDDGLVTMVVTCEATDERMAVYLSGERARALSDALFRQSCNADQQAAAHGVQP